MNMSAYIDCLEKKASDSIKADDGDYYGDDGLLYCGKCHTPKQGRYKMPWGDVTPMLLCKCQSEKRDKEEAERKHREFQESIKKMRQYGFPESDMQGWTFEKADGSNEKLIGAGKKYVEHFSEFYKQGKGLLLFGTVGTGKTYLSACIANALIDKGHPVLMTNFARIANTVSGMYEGKQEYYDSLNRYHLLILDDLSAERKTEYMQEIVFNVIDSRYRAGLPMIVTTNLTSEELKHPSDIAYQRTFSRLLEMCLPIKVEGYDKRLAKLKAEINPMREMLGL